MTAAGNTIAVYRRLLAALGMRRRARRLGAALASVLLLGGCWVWGLPAAAQQSKPEEYQVKAVYLFNFGKFVEWPAAAKGDAFTICVLGSDPFGVALDKTVASEQINNAKLMAKRIGNARDSAGCQILFVSASESRKVKDVLGAVERSGVLTVSDMPGFVSSGGMIGFVLKENKVRFEVNLGAAQRAGLMLSSQLLKVATEIKRAPGGQEAPQ